jgi:hypothetical protein
MALVLVAGAAFAGDVERVRPTRAGVPVAGADWVVEASPEALTAQPEAESSRSLKSPVTQVWTDAYVYTAGTAAEVTITIRPNGWSAPATMYLYRQDRSTGVKEYFNLPTRDFLAAGEAADLFGSVGAPIAIEIPTLPNFKLFGAGGALGSAVDGSPTGRYQMVFEIRDASGSRVISKSNTMYSYVDSVVQVTSNVLSDTTWTNNNAYFIATKAVFVRNSTLTIEPGTFVFGSKAQQSALVIDRGAKINANGTAMNPIVFTTDQPIGTRGRADWGGLIVNGFAPVNVGEGVGEGNTGTYGGNDPDDNSGVLRYVRVEFAGIEFSPENELNGIAFQGVGRGTVVDHVQVHFNKDDGVEFFGGTVNAKNLLLTANADDSVDWVEGWTGSLQFVVVQQSGDDADNGIEADNKSSNNDLEPRSNPKIFNVTLIGDPDSNEGGESDIGMLLREGTAGIIRNAIVAGFKDAPVDIVGSSQAQATAGALTVRNSIFFNTGPYNNDFSQSTIEGDATNRITDPMLADPYMLLRPDVEPLAGSPAFDIRYVATPPDDGFLVPTDYLGAVAPGNNWVLTGWATFLRN